MNGRFLLPLCFLLIGPNAFAADNSAGMPWPCRDTLPTVKKAIASVDVRRNVTTVTVTYTDGTTETMTEAEAVQKGLIHNDGYDNFKNETAGSTRMTLRTKTDSTKPLLVVDGQEANYSVDEIDPNEIATVAVWKGAAAKVQYGEKGRNGVVEITLKKRASNSETESDGPADEWRGRKVFQLLQGLETDKVLSYRILVQDDNENILASEQHGTKLTDHGRKTLAKSRKGSSVIFENIRVKRDGKALKLPATSHKL